jgi:hypothetical protein
MHLQVAASEPGAGALEGRHIATKNSQAAGKRTQQRRRQASAERPLPSISSYILESPGETANRQRHAREEIDVCSWQERSRCSSHFTQSFPDNQLIMLTQVRLPGQNGIKTGYLSQRAHGCSQPKPPSRQLFAPREQVVRNPSCR